jgi:hypothetical protein
MKEFFSLGLVVLVCFMLTSWGCLGHQTIGGIAERHLTPKAKAAVAYYLDDQNLGDAGIWADEIRIRPQYKNTNAWHHISLPAGLSYPEFEKKVTTLPQDNIYKALMQCEQDLCDSSKSRQEKTEALKFIIHLVGDLHQPMHVSRAEDRNGNKIYVSFEGKSMDLHALWDTRLLEHTGLTADQLANQWDQATPAQIKEWQSDPLIQWLWESYQVSTQLYKEIAQMNSPTITKEYYQKLLSILEERIEKAGIRLAGLLNELFKTSNFPITP